MLRPPPWVSVIFSVNVDDLFSEIQFLGFQKKLSNTSLGLEDRDSAAADPMGQQTSATSSQSSSPAAKSRVARSLRSRGALEIGGAVAGAGARRVCPSVEL